MKSNPHFDKSLKSIRRLCAKRIFDRALRELDWLIAINPSIPFLWIMRGDLLQVAPNSRSRSPLRDAAVCYKRALALNPKDLDAMESLAHYYDAVLGQPRLAQRYARKFIASAKVSIDRMEKIIAE
jgi:hypothetical protein